ncbi:MAG: DinB family protein [Oscillospiraceae bacterium]|nr:DinB family protein [Oscillospiraceae bacterium]
MKYFGNDLGSLHKELSGIIRKKGKFSEARELFNKLHSQLHSSAVYGCGDTEFDRLMNGINGQNCGSALWELWHISRIEDITAGILIDGGGQVFSADTAEKIGSPVFDTGNAMTDDEILEFASRVSLNALLDYRNAVGRRTREIISRMTDADVKRRFPDEAREMLFSSGGLIHHPDSEWLADYWLSKDCAGLILMPLTRHQLLHLNQCGQYFAKLK